MAQRGVWASGGFCSAGAQWAGLAPGLAPGTRTVACLAVGFLVRLNVQDINSEVTVLASPRCPQAAGRWRCGRAAGWRPCGASCRRRAERAYGRCRLFGRALCGGAVNLGCPNTSEAAAREAPVHCSMFMPLHQPSRDKLSPPPRAARSLAQGPTPPLGRAPGRRTQPDTSPHWLAAGSRALLPPGEVPQRPAEL